MVNPYLHLHFSLLLFQVIHLIVCHLNASSYCDSLLEDGHDNCNATIDLMYAFTGGLGADRSDDVYGQEHH